MDTRTTIKLNSTMQQIVDRIMQRDALADGPTAAVETALRYWWANHQEDTMTEYYTIDGDKLAQVVRLFNEQVDPKATDELVRSEICAEWNDNDHQDWIDSASVEEIVDWLASFYEN